MKTQEEINDFCDKLKTAWSNVSDLNFGKLMSIVQSKAKSRGRDIFFMADEELIKLFEEFDKW